MTGSNQRPDIVIWVVRIVYACVCAGYIAGYVAPGQGVERPHLISEHPFVAFVALLVITQLFTLGDVVLPRKRLDLISAIYFGLLIGVLLSYLIQLALQPVALGSARPLVNGLTLIILPYICITLLLQTRDDFRFVIPYIEFAREIRGGRPLIIDTSALVDGRIADLMDTHTFDNEMIVPSFVLEELQEISDSTDRTRRSRGRRGLDVLDRLQKQDKIEIKMYEVKDKDVAGQTVDQRIVALAKNLGGRVVTNDFNLKKVASVQGVDVINLNDVANALKPRYLPGEQLRIKVVREGEAAGQGVGYLDDGTMVVCAEASHLLGRDIEVVVTSVLQNSAGRMIFGRPGNAPPPPNRDSNGNIKTSG